MVDLLNLNTAPPVSFFWVNFEMISDDVLIVIVCAIVFYYNIFTSVFKKRNCERGNVSNILKIDVPGYARNRTHLLRSDQIGK